MPEIAFNYMQESKRVVEALRTEFPTDTVVTDEGYNGRVHVKVVSSRFNGMNEEQKQQMIHDILRERLGADAQAVSLAMAYGTDEL